MTVRTSTVTIADAATESSVLDVDDFLLSGIKTPAGWTTADITFQACETATGTFAPVYDTAGAVVTITAAAASRWYAITPQDFAGTPFLKLVSSVAQAAGDSIVITARKSE